MSKKVKAQSQKSAQKSAEKAVRKAVIATALEMSRSGLSPGRSGNVSCRWNDGFLITPTGLALNRAM
jgi:ribulose-5-phosphate 4-epimerase/fuculose-1-phosphate aldolase